MGQALYRKYRPKSLAELIGQEHITTALGNALKTGRISHAYLLTGPRGVGKTSIARILAHDINGLPYGSEAPLDIIEIDAASNRRIEEIRDLRDRVNTAPASAKYKVYIIDEVHMLTREAMSALLKTLEEPPAHVIFILATTEAHKLPETIISRTQRYSFRPVAAEQVVDHLKTIAAKEKITIDDEALQLIASHGEGSFRDSIGLLDQASNTTGKIGRAEVEKMLGLAPADHILALQRAIQTHQTAQVVQTLAVLYAQGYEPAMVAVQLGETLRSAMLASTFGGQDRASLFATLRQLLDVPASRSPKQLLELVLLEAALAGEAAVLPQKITEITPAPGKTPLTDGRQSKPSTTPPPVQPAETETVTAPAHATPSQVGPQTEPDVLQLWQQVLDEIKKQYNTLYGIARMATPELTDNKLTLHLKFAFHQKRLNEARNRKIFSDVVERLSGRPIEIVCVVSDNSTTAATRPDVKTISNIFGGAELLES